MSAPEWDRGYGLSWSGRWHLITRTVGNGRSLKSSLGACGTYVYAEVEVPKYHGQMVHIARGQKPAPVCKRCAKAKAAQ